MTNQRSVLGVCWIVYGILRLIAGIILVVLSGTATVMFGALLTRVPNPFALMDYFHIVYVAWIVLTALCGILGILAGLALLANQSSARSLAVFAAFCSLCDLPFGITLGTYTLLVLFGSRPGTERSPS